METRSDKRFFFGIILIVLGIILILDRLNLIPGSVTDILISWQMLLIGIGVLSLIGGNRTAGIILIAVGGFFILPEFVTIPREVRRIYWPLILVAVGVAMLFRQKGSLRFISSDEPKPESPKEDSLSTFDDFIIFGGREVFINSQNLASGKATSIFGGIEFDLRKAQIRPEGAIIDCVSIFGGCGFKIPMDWNIKNEVTTIFGAFTDKRGETYNDKYYDPSKTVIIKGVSIFGGIEIKHF